MLAKTIKYAGVGFLLGIAIGLSIAWATGSLVSPELIAQTGGYVPAAILQFFGCGLYGAFCMGGVMFYEIESWPLALSSAAHYLLIAVLYVPASLLLGWADKIGDILIMEGIQFVAYFFIWFVIWLRYRKKVRHMNEKLDELRDDHAGGSSGLH